jgi:hypothetical protein
MGRLKVAWVISLVLAALLIAAVSFLYGRHIQPTEENRSLASAQAMLAFGHYKFYNRIESLIARKCYEPALTEARELKNLQLTLLSENLRASGNDPELMEYIKVRDPKLLEIVLVGRVPELRTYTTTCP